MDVTLTPVWGGLGNSKEVSKGVGGSEGVGGSQDWVIVN